MSNPERGGAAGLAAAAASGLLLAAAYPRPGLSGLGFVALVPLLAGVAGCPPARALLRGFVCGAVFFSALLYWVAGVMTAYGGLPWVAAIPLFLLLVAYLALYPALFAAAVAAAWRRRGALALAASPFLWVALEIVRARLLTGFPWGLLGYSQTANLPLLQTAALGGVYLVSFLVLGVNAALAILALRWRDTARPPDRPALAAAGILLGLAVAAHGWGWIVLGRAPGGAAGEPVPAAAVQANVPQERKWDEASGGVILDDLDRLTRRAAADGARLVVWPESSSPFAIRLPARGGADGREPMVAPHDAYLGRLRGLAAETGTVLLVGTVDYRVMDGRLRATNSAALVTPGRGLTAVYDKIHLVPFGEYVPMPRILFFVDRLAGGTIADFAPGRGGRPLVTPWGGAAVFICYEAIFPELVRRLAPEEAVFLINITNDAWFGRSSAPAQHLAMAVVRAVETGRDLLRAANTGISAVVDPRGRVVARAGIGEQAVLHGALTPRRGRTPYARTGDVFAGACAILALSYGAALRAAFARRGF
jgi:apolipoprotein N-acyltransferase